MTRPIDLILNGATWTPIEGQPPDDGRLHATHSGVLSLAEFGTLKCWRLSDGRATVDAEDLARLFGFASPEDLAADIENLGNSELAARLRAPIEFDRGQQ